MSIAMTLFWAFMVLVVVWSFIDRVREHGLSFVLNLEAKVVGAVIVLTIMTVPLKLVGLSDHHILFGWLVPFVFVMVFYTERVERRHARERRLAEHVEDMDACDEDGDV